MTTSASTTECRTDNVIDLFTRQPYSERSNRRFIRLAPEHDRFEMLYSNTAHPDRVFSTRILCWGLRENGEIVGLVPWLDQIVACPEIQDPLNGQWEGYFDPGSDEVFYEAPIHKALELETAAEYYDYVCERDDDIVQEIPDVIGTHAVFSGDGFKTLNLKEVISWRLLCDGTIDGMVADTEKIVATPVLAGDDSLFAAVQAPEFRYYFQHHIANKIKARDPDALAAIAILAEP